MFSETKNKMCFYFNAYFQLLIIPGQGHIEAKAQAEPPVEILVPDCLKPEEGLEVWCLWTRRKNEELERLGKAKLAPIGRQSTSHSHTQLS